MHKRLALACLTSACLPFTLQAEDNNWNVSVGAGYRLMGDVKFHGRAFSNPALPGTPFVNGTLPNNGVVGTPVAVLDPALQVPGALASLDSLAAAPGGHDTDGRGGLTLGLGRTVGRADNLRLDWDLNGGLWTGFDTDFRTAAAVTSTGYPVTLPAVAPNVYSIAFPAGAGTATTAGWVDRRFKMDGYSLGTGLSGTWTPGRLFLTGGVGVSVFFADLSTSQTETVQWLTGTPLYSRRESSDDFQVIPGLYANAGVGVKLTKTVDVSLNYRYDWFSKDAGTNLADVKLTGGTAELKLTYRF